ncbi:UNVERIFIED_CONTAM: SAC3 family protein B [Sesamum latifolium]|uniref:SAC3 family protein B n=1 Tax=Sesamum latifolium TaxID=2727402 RepID=A0AAW2XWN4_9LAMI
MTFGGFGKNSGPSTSPGAQNPFAHFPRAPSPSSSAITQTYQRPPMIMPLVASSNLRTGAPEKPGGVQYSKITNSPYSQSPDETPKNSRSVIERLLPSTMWVDQSKSSSNNTTHPAEDDMPSVLTTGGPHQSGRTPQTKHADSPLPKRTRSPTLPSSSEGFKQNSVSDSDGLRRIWKRRTAKKRELREHKQVAANAAFSLLSLGPPIWQCEAQAGNYGTFDIDHVMSERHEIQERSWSVLNPSDVVAAKLAEKNPDAKCLCWKMILCSQEEAMHGDSRELQTEASMSAAGSWLHSKLMPASNDGDRNLLVSSRGLAIWRSWIPGQSGTELTCCLSVIKSSTNEDLDKAMIGASAVLFLLSEHIPLGLQRKWLHDLVMLLPSGSRLPLLILSGSGKDESLPSTIAKDLGLHDIDKSRVSTFYITFLKDKDTKELDGFFSDEHLREGLEWLATESPPQVAVSKTKTRELVLSRLNMLEVCDEINTHRLGPNNCISAFNEALGRSMEEVAAAAHANPTGWPCPEIDLLEESSDEYRATAWYLPSIGWSAASRTEELISAMSDSKLPTLEDDLSWLAGGLNISDDIENQKSRLEVV